MNNERLGEIAYNAYCSSRNWKSIRGEPLPAFQAQSKELQEAWIVAAKAVSDTIHNITSMG